MVERVRVIEIVSPASDAGRRVLAGAIAAVQSSGGIAALLLGGGGLAVDDCEAGGCDLSELLVSSPADEAEACDVLEMLVQSGAVDLVETTSLFKLRG